MALSTPLTADYTANSLDSNLFFGYCKRRSTIEAPELIEVGLKVQDTGPILGSINKQDSHSTQIQAAFNMELVVRHVIIIPNYKEEVFL